MVFEPVDGPCNPVAVVADGRDVSQARPLLTRQQVINDFLLNEWCQRGNVLRMLKQVEQPLKGVE